MSRRVTIVTFVNYKVITILLSLVKNSKASRKREKGKEAFKTTTM